MTTRYKTDGDAVADASTTVSGKVRLATIAEAGGALETIAVTPAGLQAEISGIVSGIAYKGTYNATTSLPSLNNALLGDFYKVSAQGTLAGVSLNVGDHIVFNSNVAGGVVQSTDFDVIDNTESVTASTDLTDSADLARLASPAFTGNPTATTQLQTDNSTRLATTAYVQTAVSGVSSYTDEQALDFVANALVTGTHTNISFTHDDVNDEIDASVSLASTDLTDSADLARLASPAFTGNPTATTQLQTDNSTRLATTAYVQTAVSGASGGGFTYQARETDTHSPLTPSVNYHYSINANTASFVINLPLLSSVNNGDQIRIKLQARGNPAYDVTVNRNAGGSDTIDGQTSLTLDVLYSSVTIVAGSTEWEVV